MFSAVDNAVLWGRVWQPCLRWVRLEREVGGVLCWEDQAATECEGTLVVVSWHGLGPAIESCLWVQACV